MVTPSDGVLAANDRYRRLVERSPDGILVSRDGTIQFANRAAASLAGTAEPADLVGTSLFDLFHPDSHGRLREAIARLKAGDAVAPIEDRILRGDGAVTDVLASAMLLDDEAGEPLLVLTMRDITRRRTAEASLRESEERLRLAFDGAQEGVWDWNLETGE